MIILGHKAGPTTDVLQENDHKEPPIFLPNTKDVFSQKNKSPSI